MLISLESIYRSYVAVALILSGWLKTAKLEGESPPVIGTDLPWWGRVGAGQLVDLGKICQWTRSFTILVDTNFYDLKSKKFLS